MLKSMRLHLGMMIRIGLPLGLLLACVCLSSGCGLAQGGALGVFTYKSPIPPESEATREEILAVAKKHPMDALISPTFYHIASAEDVSAVINGRDLQGKSVTTRQVTFDGIATGTPLALVEGLFFPIYGLKSSHVNPCESALRYSADPEVMRVMGKAGCDMSGMASDYLHMAEKPDPAMLAVLLEAAPLGADSGELLSFCVGNYTITPEIMQVFMAKARNLDLNYQSQYMRDTALMYAAQGGDRYSVKLLLEAGADLELEDRTGERAVGYAVVANKVDVAKDLIAAGANCSYVTADGTLLNKARKSGGKKPDKELLRLLTARAK